MLLKPVSLALAAGLALGAPMAMASPEQPVAAEHVTAPSAPVTSQQDASRYAQREQKDQKVADYQGGDVLIVGASGAALLVVLLLLLVLI